MSATQRRNIVSGAPNPTSPIRALRPLDENVLKCRSTTSSREGYPLRNARSLRKEALQILQAASPEESEASLIEKVVRLNEIFERLKKSARASQSDTTRQRAQQALKDIYDEVENLMKARVETLMKAGEVKRTEDLLGGFLHATGQALRYVLVVSTRNVEELAGLVGSEEAVRIMVPLVLADVKKHTPQIIREMGID